MTERNNLRKDTQKTQRKKTHFFIKGKKAKFEKSMIHYKDQGGGMQPEPDLSGSTTKWCVFHLSDRQRKEGQKLRNALKTVME